DGSDRLLRRHRELFALPDRPQAGRAAADPVRVPAARRAADRGRDAAERAAPGAVTKIFPPSRPARRRGEPPPTLFEYLPHDALLIVDESHVTVPQIGAMFRGDYQRKSTLAEFGFRLPSCIDNRPLRFEEWNAMRPQTVYVSATPGGWEMEQTGGVFAEQVIRPTGLIDPPVEIRPIEDQVDDLVNECRIVAQQGYRALVTTLTKRMAED